MTIALLNGQEIDSHSVRLEGDNIHFTNLSTGEDITRLMRVADKKSFPLFDLTKSNSEIYATDPTTGNLIPAAPTDGTFSIFTDQMLINPLGAPVEALNTGVSQIFGSSGLQKLVVVAVIGAVVVLYFKREFAK
jgi:hypothetical protein